MAAADELGRGSLRAAERYLQVAESGLASVPSGRRGQAQVLLGVVRLLLCGRSGDQWTRAERAQRLLAAAEAAEAAQHTDAGGEAGTGSRAWGREELRTLALLEVGNAETWIGRLDQAESRLDQAIALARRIRWPYLEFMGLVYRAEIELSRQLPDAATLSRQAIDLAEQHGWTADLFMGFAANTLGAALTWLGQLDEADAWVQRAERTFIAEADPASAMGAHYVRGQLELGCGRAVGALAAFRAAEQLAGPNPLARPLRAWLLLALVRLGDTESAEQALADLSERDRDRREMRTAAAALRLAQHDPAAATEVLSPVLDGSIRGGWGSWLAEAFLLEAIARDALGDPGAASNALERALDLAELDGTLLWFLLHPAPGLLERHARQQTAHAALLAQIRDLLAASRPAPLAERLPLEPLSKSEVRVLRYLPTHLSAREIADELSVSTSTVKTHMRNLYGKLGTHRRTEAVERARELGLLAPSAGGGMANTRH